MTSRLLDIITSPEPAVRNQPLEAVCAGLPASELLAHCDELETFRRSHDNLYQRVRALFFLYAIHRFHLPPALPGSRALIPYEAYESLLGRRFEESIRLLLKTQAAEGPSPGLSSALAAAYRSLAFQTLADQVRRSVRSVAGNRWMFRTGHTADYPLRLRPELTSPDPATGLFPVLRETTPVRMDLSHSGWSDIFFLGMDFPEGARVLNISIDLTVRRPGAKPQPPVESYLRVIDEPVLRLTSVDLGATVDLHTIDEVFDFAKDYLGLLKAAVIAAGLVPSGMEGAARPLSDLFAPLLGSPHLGLELVSKVNDIPKGSRLAVSTNLLSCLIAVCMRATSQAKSLTGALTEEERRVVAARAILGEWLGGSGGGWQDSGGVWPGIKLIEGVAAGEGDPEFGISRGRLLPRHTVWTEADVSREARERLQNSLVLVHGGMAQDVGPVLEMVTEKYLLRSGAEWHGRQEAMRLFDEILATLRAGDIRGIGDRTHRNFHGPIQTIIPWAGNHYTDGLIERVRAEFGSHFHGFWMLGGMAGGGMGFLFDPDSHPRALDRLAEIMPALKRELEHAVPFAMEPVVYDFAINPNGTWAELKTGADALLPAAYYSFAVPPLVRKELRSLPPSKRAELARFSAACQHDPSLSGAVEQLFERLLPRAAEDGPAGNSLPRLLAELGFDTQQHEKIRADLKAGRIGLAQNRLPASTTLEDAPRPDILVPDPRRSAPGEEAIRAGTVAVVTLAGGVGTRWTRGAGVVKGLNPFHRMAGRHRSFIDVHLAKTRRTSRLFNTTLPHIFTTSYLTHTPTEQYLCRLQNAHPGPVLLSPGRAVGLRMVPMVRDLRYAWEESPQQLLDEQKQKVRESLHAALVAWALSAGEAADYTDNLPMQCLHPVGHWFEVPNLLRNGVLRRLLDEQPRLRYLMVHNVDTLGAAVDPAVLTAHIESGAAGTFEVIDRWVEDRGGGLAKVNGRLRLVEGLAMPDERAEFALSYYNSGTTWLDIDRFLALFKLDRYSLGNETAVAAAVRAVTARMPTYITLKDVKRRWGKGQEDIFPVAQFEKLWGDVTALPEFDCRFALVPRRRGQQLKEVAQLDGWVRDGSAAYVEGLCDW
ncbi:MAG: UTP--glucose-1-phosphate uridylyltransferase [Bryobacteraceae bacterium]|nr:UTP--glucose-1-phosphate uridylyltransferase [Bryobacteraceae bacterium]